MDPMIEIFWILWFLVLPIMGIALTILVPVVWFFIVPKVARMLTWTRFKSVSIHAIADDSGFVELVTTKVELPEGVVKTDRGWRFLPRPIWKSLKRRKKKKGDVTEKDLSVAERFALRKYVLKGLGKPFWFGYAGMVNAMNPPTLAVLQQGGSPVGNPTVHFSNIRSYIDSLPKKLLWNNRELHPKKDLTKMLDDLHERVKTEPYTVLDPRAVKEVLPEMTPPSLMEAIETYSEMVGMEERGKNILPIILIAGIVGMLVFGVIALMMLTG